MREYEFSIMLDTSYTEENILSILENGLKLGCIYKDRLYNKLDTNIAMMTIWKQHWQQTPPLIRVECYNAYFNIWFYNRNNKIYLYFGPTHIAWKKRYDLSAWYSINFYRYQKFMLRLINNNTITHFETYEYFDASYDAENMANDKKIYIKFYTYWAYDVYHHLIVNGRILRITWLDSNKQPINIKSEDNTLENIIYNEDTNQCWYGIHNDIILKFSYIKDRTIIIEPTSTHALDSNTLDQAQVLDKGLRTTIELFKNMPVLRLITFQNDEDIQNINKMDE